MYVNLDFWCPFGPSLQPARGAISWHAMVSLLQSLHSSCNSKPTPSSPGWAFYGRLLRLRELPYTYMFGSSYFQVARSLIW